MNKLLLLLVFREVTVSRTDRSRRDLECVPSPVIQVAYVA